MSDFLISSFSPVMVNPLTPWENESLDMDWSKESLGKVRFLQHPLKKFFFAGDCIIFEPVHRPGKLGSIRN